MHKHVSCLSTRAQSISEDERMKQLDDENTKLMKQILLAVCNDGLENYDLDFLQLKQISDEQLPCLGLQAADNNNESCRVEDEIEEEEKQMTN